ncbi:DUF4397 domain-containing protein [uncultured Chitinophaga sp.]|uniref:DUF4397 domain-containing protein n=1 Tax=uncultured Chitinophaga sp. TaxID=339340 RepID=UPI0025E9632A|nr:DUF4397 domain-containing protein [uncultured Chitinophaga sp.]
MLKRTNRLWTLVAVAALMTAGLTSCLKKGDNAPAKPYAVLALLNAAVHPGSVDVYQNSKKITTGAFASGKYALLQIDPGTQEFGFRKFGSDSTLDSDLALYDTLAWHTLVLYNNYSPGSTDSSVQLANLIENYTGIETTKANIRFFHLSPDAGIVRFFVNDVEVHANRTYADFVGSSSYRSYTAANTGAIKFEARAADGTTVIASKTDQVANGNVYTIYLSGLVNIAGTDPRKVALSVYWHNPYYLN